MFGRAQRSNGMSASEENPTNPQSGFVTWWKDTVALLRPHVLDRLRIVDLAEPVQTMEGIERDTEFRGFNLWILVFSILIASIGLNVNSTAVIIGAMLISPLMGPIMGVGLGVVFTLFLACVRVGCCHVIATLQAGIICESLRCVLFVQRGFSLIGEFEGVGPPYVSGPVLALLLF